MRSLTARTRRAPGSPVPPEPRRVLRRPWARRLASMPGTPPGRLRRKRGWPARPARPACRRAAGPGGERGSAARLRDRVDQGHLQDRPGRGRRTCQLFLRPAVREPPESAGHVPARHSALAPAYWTAEVVAGEQRQPGLAILTVAPDQPLPYLAGQHVTVQTPRWPRVWRPYSVANCPRDDGLMTFHVRAVPGGGSATPRSATPSPAPSSSWVPPSAR